MMPPETESGPRPEPYPDRLTLTAARAEFPRLQTWLEAMLTRLQAPPRELRQVLVAADEIFCNIAEHGYPPETVERPVEVTAVFAAAESQLQLVFTDRGPEFNPLAVDAAGLAAERLRRRLAGGLGLLLVRQFMDRLAYRREEGCNILTLGKELHLPPAEHR